MALALDIATGLLLAVGSAFYLIGAFGLVRMPDVFTRLHAASVMETLGAGSLLFGMMIAPIVTPHYAQLDFLVIPPMATIVKVLFTRSALLLLVSLPVIVGWRGSRRQLFLALSLGHFFAVGFAGLIQTPFFPAVLRWTHGIEILADSVCYAWALVWLFFPRRDRAAEEAQELRERLA